MLYNREDQGRVHSRVARGKEEGAAAAANIRNLQSCDTTFFRYYLFLFTHYCRDEYDSCMSLYL